MKYEPCKYAYSYGYLSGAVTMALWRLKGSIEACDIVAIKAAAETLEDAHTIAQTHLEKILEWEEKKVEHDTNGTK